MLIKTKVAYTHTYSIIELSNEREINLIVRALYPVIDVAIDVVPDDDECIRFMGFHSIYANLANIKHKEKERRSDRHIFRLGRYIKCTTICIYDSICGDNVFWFKSTTIKYVWDTLSNIFNDAHVKTMTHIVRIMASYAILGSSRFESVHAVFVQG